MNIALVRRKFTNKGSGGAEKTASRFVAEFIKRGHSIVVFSEIFDAEGSDRLKWVKVERTGLPSLSRTASFHKNVQRHLKENSFDIVYTMCRTYPTDVFRVTEQLHTEWLPIMYPRISRLNPRHRGILKLERRALSPENTKHIVTNSCLVKKQVAKNYNFPADRISVVRNGIDRNVFYPSFDYSEKEALRRKNNIPDKAFVMLFAAGNFKIKGLDTALEALRLLPDKIKAHTVLLIAGGDSPLPFRRKIKKLGIEKNTVFIGRRADMRDFYVASDLLLYPSMYEPFANVCLEACACALPVLTTQVNGSSELVSHKKNGYIIKDSGRVKETFEHIQSFFSMSDAERDKFGKAALEASKGYSWEKHAEGLENIFLKILNGKNEN